MWGKNFIFYHGGGQKLKIGIDGGGGGQKKIAKFVKIPPTPRLINNDCSLIIIIGGPACSPFFRAGAFYHW